MKDRCTLTQKDIAVIKAKLKSIIQIENNELIEEYNKSGEYIKKFLLSSPKVKKVDLENMKFEVEVVNKYDGLPLILKRDFSALGEVRTYTLLDLVRTSTITSQVGQMYEVKNLYNRLASPEKLEVLVDNTINSCKARAINFEEFNSTRKSKIKPKELIEKVSGIHETSDPKFQFYISSDPVDIFMKSSGQTWAHNSCERWGGGYSKGIFSDIENGSLVCFVMKKGKRNPAGSLARVMLRQCYVKLAGFPYSHSLTLGLEAYWYTGDYRLKLKSTQRLGRTLHTENISAATATRDLRQLLANLGLMMNYNVCRTPFKYSGFSDAIINSCEEIQYSSEYVDCEECSNPIPKALAKEQSGLCANCCSERDDNHDHDDDDDDDDDDHD